MAGKRRILVVFKHGDSSAFKERKLAIAVDDEATIDTLAKIIAEKVGELAVSLEIGDGYVLDPNDTVEFILNSDIVVAKPCVDRLRSETDDAALMDTSGNENISRSSDTNPITPAPNKIDDKIASTNTENGPGRFRLRFVTAELAREHAKKTLKGISEPSNGMLAFDGEFISENTTFAAIGREAARMFHWACDQGSFDEGSCDHAHSSFCSCAVAQEIVQHGLSSTFHCRFTVDGTNCANTSCPYSHAPLTTNQGFRNQPPHCSVCTDALAFPCPSCLAKANESDADPSSIIYCPIVQNAGCHHLHHAHCIRSRTLDGCPSGCPRRTVLREAVPFDQTVPCLIIVWDGNKIDRVPILSDDLRNENTILQLPVENVLSKVEQFLISNRVQVDRMSVRIHSRNPLTETVPFIWSTLISVCSSLSHQNPDHHRFSLSTKVVSMSSNRQITGPCVDFHTSQQPLFVCNCTRLKDAFPNAHNPDTDITLYVVQRQSGPGPASNPKHNAIPVSKQSAYLLDSAWQPPVLQTKRGMAALLSTLYVLSQMKSKEGIIAENKLLAALYAVTRFPPAVRTLGLLYLNITPSPQERAALSSAIFYPLEDFLRGAPSVIKANKNRWFEVVRIFFGHLLTLTDSTPAATRPLQSFSLVCPWSQRRLVDPVIFGLSIVERNVGSHFGPGGLLYRPEHGVEIGSATELSQSEALPRVLLHSAEYLGSEIYSLQLQDIVLVDRLRPLEDVAWNLSNIIKRTNESDLVSHGPLELKSPNVIPPQIVLDAEGYLAVFTGRGCGSVRDVNFFQPTSGGDTEVDVNDVEHTLQKTIEARKAEDTWEIDCFGGTPAKARTPNEAVVFCLDLSRSMNEKSAVGGSDAPPNVLLQHTSELVSSVEEVLENCKPAEILSYAKRFIREQHEHCLSAWVSLTKDQMSCNELARHLSVIASREVLRFQSMSSPPYDKDQLLQLASFASLYRTEKKTVVDDLSSVLTNFKPDSGTSGSYIKRQHSKKLRSITIKFPDTEITQTITLPSDASPLALLSDVRSPQGRFLSDIRLWYGVKGIGDGYISGFILDPMDTSIPGASFECRYWHWVSPKRERLSEKSRSLTRLELLKELFNIFLNRVSSFDTSVSLVLGLVTFSDKAHMKQALTPIFEKFRLELDEVEASGDTAMYDALDLARSSLINFRKDLPGLRRRIVLVSDGEDTSSVNDVEDVGVALQRDNIIVDSVQIGTSLSTVLQRISAATTGYRFFPKSTLAEALSIFDLETMMYSAERPTRKKMPLGAVGKRIKINSWDAWRDAVTYPIDVVTMDQFPQRAQHPKLKERVRDVKKTIGDVVLSNDRIRRIMRELKALKADPHPQIDVYVNDQDMSFFKVVIEAPSDIEQCPYKGGCFLLTCDLPVEYPRDPPEIRFVTFILHPNVSKQGKVCVAELSRLWSSDITLKELFSLVYGLLLEPDLDNPLEIQASLKYYDDDGTFALAAADAVKDHASKSRKEWRRELEQ